MLPRSVSMNLYLPTALNTFCRTQFADILTGKRNRDHPPVEFATFPPHQIYLAKLRCIPNEF